MRLTLIKILLVTTGISLNAQDSQLTLDRIFNSSDFKNQSYGPAKWVEGGKAYTTLENSTQFTGKKDIIEYNAKTETRIINFIIIRSSPKG